MPRKAINPASMYPSVQFGFSHATESSGGRTLHLAGQVAWDKDLNLVGADDLAAQARQALANLQTVLAECGGTPADVVRLRTYVVNYTPDAIAPIGAALAEFYGDVTPAANTLLGVQALAMPEFMIEIEATAVVA